MVLRLPFPKGLSQPCFPNSNIAEMIHPDIYKSLYQGNIVERLTRVNASTLNVRLARNSQNLSLDFTPIDDGDVFSIYH